MAGNEAFFVLPANFTAEQMGEVSERMMQLLGKTEPEIVCCGSKVDVMDDAGLQLLLAFYAVTVMEGRSFTVANPSQKLQETFAYSGADKIFAVKEVV